MKRLRAGAFQRADPGFVPAVYEFVPEWALRPPNPPRMP
jgi:hypothetical protein